MNGIFRRLFGEISRSDLALESYDGGDGAEYTSDVSYTPTGTAVYTEKLRIAALSAEKRTGRRRGEYVTVTSMPFAEMDECDIEKIAETVKGELYRMAGGYVSGDWSLLVAGIGNRSLTADAVGPLTAEKIEATAHLKILAPELFGRCGLRSISVIAPGVMGQTGLETAEIISAACRSAGADLVVAVDALAAGACSRLGTTIQISDAGISPGTGVGNFRHGIDRESLGVPVIAVGVPTVLSTAVIAGKENNKKEISETRPGCREKSGGEKRDFFVCPRDADLLVMRASQIIARGISGAFSHL